MTASEYAVKEKKREEKRRVVRFSYCDQWREKISKVCFWCMPTVDGWFSSRARERVREEEEEEEVGEKFENLKIRDLGVFTQKDSPT